MNRVTSFEQLFLKCIRLQTCSHRTIHRTAVHCRMRKWRRGRPFFAPMTKCRMFEVEEERDPLKFTQEEKEWDDAVNSYEEFRQAVERRFAADAVATSEAVLGDAVQRSERKRFADALLLNEEWNRDVQTVRESHMSTEARSLEENIVTQQAQLEEQAAARRQEAERLVVMEIENSERFITEDNLEEEIEKSLDSLFNMNFAIDKDGSHITTGNDVIDPVDIRRDFPKWDKDTARREKQMIG